MAEILGQAVEKWMPRSGLRSVVDTGVFEYGPERSRLLVRLWRVLAKGQPLDRTDIEAAAEAAGIEISAAIDFLATVTERDESGRISGLLGLSLNAHPHRFTVGGITFSTWCAIDTLFLPAMLDAVARVESTSPVSGKVVRLTVSNDGVSDLTPDEAVVSLPVLRADEVDTSSTEGIWRAFCHRIYFFADEGEAERWCEGKGEMEVVSVDAAWRHAAETWSTVRSHAGVRSAEAIAEART